MLGECLHLLPQNGPQPGAERCQRTCLEAAGNHASGIVVPDFPHSRGCAAGANQQRAGITPFCSVLVFDRSRQLACRLCPQKCHPKGGLCGEQMGPRAVLQATGKAVRDVDRKHLLAFAGSLAYYYFLSLIPFLILLASGLAYIPIPHLFDQVLLWMSYFIPPDSMALVRKVFADLMA